MHVHHQLTTGVTIKLLVTFGVDPARKRVTEIFCADFKAGTDQHTLIMDACVMMSLLFQHGYDASHVAGKMAAPPRSLLGTLVDAAVEVQKTL